MSGKRNRTAGQNYEREIVKRYNTFGFTNSKGEFSPLFPEVGSTRQHSHAMDANKVDITTVEPQELSKLGLVIQAKNTTNSVQYPKLLAQMQVAVDKYGQISIIYHKQTQRVQNTGTTPRFMKRGEYVMLNAQDFELLYTKLKLMEQVYEEFVSYYDSFDESIQKELSEFLKIRNL